MSLESLVGDIRTGFSHFLQNALNYIGTAGTGIADAFKVDVWSGGMAGMADPQPVKEAIAKYKEEINSAIESYNANVDVGNTFKGQSTEELQQFVKNTQELLKAYSLLVDSWTEQIDEAYKAYHETEQTEVASKIQTANEDIVKQIESIKMD